MSYPMDNCGDKAHPEQYKAIIYETAELKAKKSYIQDRQQASNDAMRYIKNAADTMRDAAPYMTVWNENILRQLLETVTVLSADRIRVTLRGGAELEWGIE